MSVDDGLCCFNHLSSHLSLKVGSTILWGWTLDRTSGASWLSSKRGWVYFSPLSSEDVMWLFPQNYEWNPETKAKTNPFSPKLILYKVVYHSSRDKTRTGVWCPSWELWGLSMCLPTRGKGFWVSNVTFFEKGSINIKGRLWCCAYLSKEGSFEEGEISKYYLFLFFVLKDVLQGLPS